MERTHRTASIGFASIAFFLSAGAPALADFDGSEPLICATVEAHDCAADLSCVGGTPNAAGAPAFLRVDVAKKMIAGPQRTTTIKLIERNERQLLLMGTELDLAWTMALDREDGAIAMTLVDHDGAFVLFGSCTTL